MNLANGMGPFAAISAVISVNNCGCPALKVTPPLSEFELCLGMLSKKPLSYRIL